MPRDPKWASSDAGGTPGAAEINLQEVNPLEMPNLICHMIRLNKNLKKKLKIFELLRKPYRVKTR